MYWMDKQQLRTRVMAGTFLNLGSATSVEIAASLGYDWLLLDLEHGSGSWAELRSMLIACNGFEVAPIVRIRSVDPDAVKFVMDSGAAGIMFPYVSSVEEAEKAVQAVKYPPRGTRGVAGIIRATNYGQDWQDYFEQANDRSLVVVQIETPEGVAQAERIAAVDGVDALFVGPLDLSVNMGTPADYSEPEFSSALRHVVAVCESHGKTAGILSKPGYEGEHRQMGFRLFALGSDSGAVVAGLGDSLSRIRDDL